MKKRKPLGTEEKKNLVAVQFQNGIGNFIMMTPAIKALCSHFDAKVDIILDNSWKDSRKIGLKEYCEWWDLVNEVKDFQDGFNKEDYVQLFYAKHGENSEAHNYFKDNAEVEADHVNWRSSRMHEIDYYMEAVYKIGYRGPVPDQQFLTGGIGNFKAEIADPNMLRIGFCNGFFAGSRWEWERKGWPYFPELANLLFRYYNGGGGNLKIYLFGKGQRELDWAETVKGDRVVSFVDQMNLLTTTSFIKYMDLFITTDTGLMHLADAMNVPMITLFSATLVSKNGPYNKEHRIVRAPLSCAPCQQSPSFHVCHEWKCMDTLVPEIVVSETRSYVRELMGKGRMCYKKDGGGGFKPCLK